MRTVLVGPPRYALIALNLLFFFVELSGGDPFIEHWSVVPRGLLANPGGDFLTILRCNMDEGGYRIRFRGVSSVPKEEGEFIIKQMQPIKKNDIYNKTLVDLAVVSP